MSLDVTSILAGFLTLACWSYLYKENPLFRFVEHLILGLSSAYIFIGGIFYIKNYISTSPMIYWIWPLLLGSILYFYFSKKYFYLYRLPLAFIIGMGAALTIRSQGHGVLMPQITRMLQPLFVADLFTSFNNLVILVGTISAVLFFTFTKKRTGVFAYTEKIGRITLMITFGATFGRVAMTRFATDIERVRSLIQTDAIYLLPIAAVLIAYSIISDRKKNL